MGGATSGRHPRQDKNTWHRIIHRRGHHHHHHHDHDLGRCMEHTMHSKEMHHKPGIHCYEKQNNLLVDSGRQVLWMSIPRNELLTHPCMQYDQ